MLCPKHTNLCETVQNQRKHLEMYKMLKYYYISGTTTGRKKNKNLYEALAYHELTLYFIKKCGGLWKLLYLIAAI